MADIFISYAREERETVAKLVRVLEVNPRTRRRFGARESSRRRLCLQLVPAICRLIIDVHPEAIGDSDVWSTSGATVSLEVPTPAIMEFRDSPAGAEFR
jgi:hypothetical protein